MTKLISMLASVFSAQMVGAFANYAYVGFVLTQVMGMYITFSVLLDQQMQSAPPGFAAAYYVSGLGIMAKMFFSAVSSGVTVRLSRRPLIALLQAFGVKKSS